MKGLEDILQITPILRRQHGEEKGRLEINNPKSRRKNQEGKITNTKREKEVVR